MTDDSIPPIEDDGYYMDDEKVDWFGEHNESIPYDEKKKSRPLRHREKTVKEFYEYNEARTKQIYGKPVTYDDQIDFHLWLRDTPSEWVFQKLKEKKCQ